MLGLLRRAELMRNLLSAPKMALRPRRMLNLLWRRSSMMLSSLAERTLKHRMRLEHFYRKPPRARK